jgi:hypothetical protein
MPPRLLRATASDDQAWVGRPERRLLERCVAELDWFTQASRANQTCSVRQIGQRVRAKKAVQRTNLS